MSLNKEVWGAYDFYQVFFQNHFIFVTNVQYGLYRKPCR